ncbi:MAG: cysteine desulfurase [Parcubacteria group bacterium]|nr:cysteine desulfurase [Parcubacteria group bacterium]
MKREEVYLDNNATTPLAPEVLVAMEPYWSEKFGNPGSMHMKGREAREAVEKSRDILARYLGNEGGIIFTSGATESVNFALKGALRRAKAVGRTHVVTSLVEHDAVLETLSALGDEGFETTYLTPDEYGRITPAAVRDALRDNTALVAIMHVNNELGTIYPVNEIASEVKKRDPEIVMFCDGVQAFGKLPVDLTGIDLYAFSAHKLHGPKGVGALFIRKGIKLQTLINGGGQEFSLRSGTENVPGIVGLGKAVELAYATHEETVRHVRPLREQFLAGLRAMNNVRINSPEDALYTTLNAAFLGIPAKTLLEALEKEVIYASIGPACAAGKVIQSHVLEALPVSEEIKRSSMRFGFSKYNTLEEVDYVLGVLNKVVPELRKAA